MNKDLLTLDPQAWTRFVTTHREDFVRARVPEAVIADPRLWAQLIAYGSLRLPDGSTHEVMDNSEEEYTAFCELAGSYARVTPRS